jgi:hypothetical protein
VSLHAVINRHVPSLKHLVGVIPDEELCERAIVDAVEAAHNEVEGETYSQLEYDLAVEDADEQARDEMRDEILDVLDKAEWETGDELSKLIREALGA